MGSPFGGKGGGGGGSSSPDPVATAQAQAAANKEAVREQALVNQINQVTPYGNLTYTGEVGAPDRTATTTLAPAQQEMLDLQNQAGIQYGQTANQQLGAISERLGVPLDYSGLGDAPQANEATRQATADAMYQRINPQWEQDRQRLETSLANQGITMGSEAWNRGMDDFNRAQTDARLAIDARAGDEMSRMFGLESAARNQAINEMVQQRQIPLNELSAMLTGSQVQGPSFVNTPQQSVAPVDIAGLTYASANLDAQRAAQRAAQSSANTQGLYSLLGTGALAAGMFYSDRRIKTDIEQIGEQNGLPVYSFRYIWGGATHIGHMADEVKEKYPHAVHRVGLFDCVDYGAIA